MPNISTDNRPVATSDSALTRPRAILFDWDNTLVDTWPAIHDALDTTFRAFGLTPWTLEETRQRVRESMRDSFPKLFGARWQDAGRVFYERFTAIHLDLLAPCAGAEDMLRRLREQGVYLGVVSNKQGGYLREEAAHLGWQKYFGRIVGATDAERDKPAADPVDLALSDSGIARGKAVWFAGDTNIDLECAFNAGCEPILIRQTPPQPGEFDSFPPFRHLGGCLALSNLVLGL